jgi:predicted nucleic acid-binding protein
MRLAPIIEAGEAATCAVVDLEVLFSARNYDDHCEIRLRRKLAYERIPIHDDVFDRAIEIQSELARSGRHRIPIPDLLIAAASESADLTLLHYDADFDTIAEVTGQRTEWVVPRGSVP